ncbi:hypothetical protein SD81_006615 [Tolypothrix campylonemoides VB511288]|nr:hypothetical protein SD81_006615 [Tolypothrix campylonemoides VB511288]
MEAVSDKITQTPTQVESIKFDRPAHKPHISWRDRPWRGFAHRAKRTLRERTFYLSYWTEAGLEKENLLQAVMDFLVQSKYFIVVDDGWSDWDLEIFSGIWSKAQIKVCTENHGGNKRLLRVQCALRMSQFATMAMVGYCLLTFVAIILGMSEVALITFFVGVFNAAVILYQNFRFGRILYYVLEIVAKELHLLPIHAKSTKSVVQSAVIQA